MKRNNARIYGLDDFGVNLRTLTSLGDRPIKLHVYFEYVDETRLFSLSPVERKRKIEEWYQKSFAAVQCQWPGKQFGRLGTKKRPYGIRGSIEAKRVRTLRSIPQIADIWIEAVSGLKRKKPPHSKHWFAVQARFAIQVEGQTKGRQSYEDRIVIVKALSADEAQRKLRRGFKDYGRPYLNPYGYRVRWAFECILDVYALIDDEVDPAGTEVFSVLRGRRLKPRYRWQSRSPKSK